jgi:hypothetical protein
MALESKPIRPSAVDQQMRDALAPWAEEEKDKAK